MIEINPEDIEFGSDFTVLNMGFQKRKPEYCKDCGRKLFWYRCFSCKVWHLPYRIVEVELTSPEE